MASHSDRHHQKGHRETFHPGHDIVLEPLKNAEHLSRWKRAEDWVQRQLRCGTLPFEIIEHTQTTINNAVEQRCALRIIYNLDRADLFRDLPTRSQSGRMSRQELSGITSVLKSRFPDRTIIERYGRGEEFRASTGKSQTTRAACMTLLNANDL